MTDDDRERERPASALYLHMSPREVWERQRDNDDYRPEAFDADGFIHTTIGEVRLLAVANQFYRADPREHVVLDIAAERVIPPVRFEDPDEVFPHLHGPLNVDAVVGVRRMRRAADGEFFEIEPASEDR